MKILKIVGIAFAVVLALLILIGLLVPNDHKSAEASRAPVESKPSSVAAPTFPPDQCLESVCVAPVYRELAALNWQKTGQNYEFNSQQKDWAEKYEEEILKKCKASQSATWSGESKDACNAIIFGDDELKRNANHHIQTSDLIKQFSGNVPVTCPFTKSKIEITNAIVSETGQLTVAFRFDKAGKLRVYQIDKDFKTGSKSTSQTLLDQLKAKHPYLLMLTEEEMRKENFIDYSWRYDQYLGIAPWGGRVGVKVYKDNENVSVTMTAPLSEFGSEIPATCGVPEKPISVQ